VDPGKLAVRVEDGVAAQLEHVAIRALAAAPAGQQTRVAPPDARIEPHAPPARSLESERAIALAAGITVDGVGQSELGLEALQQPRLGEADAGDLTVGVVGERAARARV